LAFVNVGDKIRYIADFKGRNESWPDGVWLERGNEGIVKNYHPEIVAAQVGDDFFEGIAAWALVRFDNGSETCIDSEDEDTRWERC